MKINNPVIKSACVLAYIFFLGITSYGQQCNAKPAEHISYDSSFIGGGNNTYDLEFNQFDTNRVFLSFPQFVPSKGTLIQVDIQTVINVTNSYTIESTDVISSSPKVKMNRSDVITSDFHSPFENASFGKIIKTLTLSASDGVTGSGPDFKKDGPLKTYDNYAINYSVTSGLAGFLGTGYVKFNYETITDLYSSGSNTKFTSTTADSVSFRLIYYYCLTSVLPADISNFTATKSSSGNLELNWKSPNDNIGDKYEMQKSTDGKDYTSFQTVVSKSSAANNYQIFYTPTGEDRNKVFFRIKQSEAGGSIKYSSVKAVDLDYTSTTMKVYPTVTRNSVNIYFPYAAKGDYQVSIVSITGQVMQQSVFLRTNFIKLALNSNLKTGMYIVSVINKQTSETQQSKLLIE